MLVLLAEALLQLIVILRGRKTDSSAERSPSKWQKTKIDIWNLLDATIHQWNVAFHTGACVLTAWALNEIIGMKAAIHIDHPSGHHVEPTFTSGLYVLVLSPVFFQLCNTVAQQYIGG